jgi:hypothetical protein
MGIAADSGADGHPAAKICSKRRSPPARHPGEGLHLLLCKPLVRPPALPGVIVGRLEITQRALLAPGACARCVKLAPGTPYVLQIRHAALSGAAPAFPSCARAWQPWQGVRTRLRLYIQVSVGSKKSLLALDGSFVSIVTFNGVHQIRKCIGLIMGYRIFGRFK